MNSGFKVVLLISIFLTPLFSNALHLSAFKMKNFLGLTISSSSEVKNDCDFFVKQFVFDESKQLLKIHLVRNHCSLDHIGFLESEIAWKLPYSLRGNTQLQVELFIDKKSEIFNVSEAGSESGSESEIETEIESVPTSESGSATSNAEKRVSLVVEKKSGSK